MHLLMAEANKSRLKWCAKCCSAPMLEKRQNNNSTNKCGYSKCKVIDYNWSERSRYIHTQKRIGGAASMSGDFEICAFVYPCRANELVCQRNDSKAAAATTATEWCTNSNKSSNRFKVLRWLWITLKYLHTCTQTHWHITETSRLLLELWETKCHQTRYKSALLLVLS